LVGRSVEKNIKLALKLGYLNFPRKTFVSLKEAKKKPPSSLTFLVAGSQAQVGSALERIAGGEHELKIKPQDKVVFSTDAIPGNEVAIYNLIDLLCRLGAEVSYADISSDVHVSGHGSSGDLKKLIELVKPFYLLPIGGNFRHMVSYQKLALSLGYKREQVLLPDKDQTILFSSEKKALLDKRVPVRNILVDALGIGDVGNVVLRDRQVLSEEGIVVALMVIDSITGKLVTKPEILTRGFVYVKVSERLLKAARQKIRKIFSKKPLNLRLARERVQEELEVFFFEKTGRRPMVLTYLIKV